MSSRSVIMLTTGESGSGKSYIRCARFLVDEFLPEEIGTHWSNFPLGEVPSDHAYPPDYDGETFKQRICKTVARKKDCSPDDVAERIQIIPDTELRRWLNGQSGPWDFFRDVDLAGCHIAIDEIHNYCGRKTPRATKQKWQEWLGEIRHRRATIEFLSQHPQKIATEIEYEAGVRLQLVNEATRRDPIFGILIGEWYEIKAGLLRLGYTRAAWVLEKRQVDKKWVTQDKRRIILDGDYFKYYDSFSAPQKGGEGGQLQKQPWQRMNPLSLLWWFIKRNLGRLALRGAIIAFVVWFAARGRLISGFVERMTNYATGQRSSETAVSSDRSEEESGAEAANTRAVSVDAIDVGIRPVSAPGEAGGSVVPQSLADGIISAQVELIDDLNKQIEASKLEAEKLRKQLGVYDGVSCILGNQVVWGNGRMYDLGDKIESGLYEGRTIESVDVRKRLVILDSGESVGMLRPAGRSLYAGEDLARP